MSKDEKTDSLSNTFSSTNIKRMFTDDVSSFSDEQAANSWTMIDLLEKIIKTRKESLRATLLERAEKSGTKKENGSFEATMGNINVINERRQEKLPDENVVKQLLKEANLEFTDAFNEDISWVMNPSKVEFLVQCGKLPADKIEASKKVTSALKMKPNEELKKQLDTVKKQLTAD
jgi:hypothetical protein